MSSLALQVSERIDFSETEVRAASALVARCRPTDVNVGLGATAGGPRLLAYRSDALVGVLGMSVKDGETSLCVDPVARRCGVGRALIAAADARFAREGVTEMLVECDASSESGRAFLLALGGEVRFAEFRLRLADRTALPTPTNSVALTTVNAERIATFERSSAISFGRPENDDLEELIALLESPDQRFYLARAGGRDVGGLRIGFLGDETYLAAFHIRPDARGKGFGRELLIQVCRQLFDEGRADIRIETRTDNTRALGLYQSCGFEIERRYDFYARRVSDPKGQ